MPAAEQQDRTTSSADEEAVDPSMGPAETQPSVEAKPPLKLPLSVAALSTVLPTESSPKAHLEHLPKQKWVEGDDDCDYDCGLGAWKPKSLQRFATSKYFLIVYGMLGTVQAMAFVYFVGTLTTIEKRFGIQSKTTGWMLSGNEVSQILMSPFLSYYGGQRNRPVWIAWGVAFSALSCFVLASPHFIYGAGSDALGLTLEYSSGNSSYAEKKDVGGLCSAEPRSIGCSPGSEALWAPLLIFASQFILGIGTTLYYSLGQPYIDDNSKKSNTPMLLGLTMALRTIGPSFGFLVSYLCLSLYIDPYLTPTITSKDPRWLGAWWLGWVILGTVMFLQGILIAFFPKRLRKPTVTEKPASLHPLEQPLKKKPDHNCNNETVTIPQTDRRSRPPPKAKDFLPALLKLMKNKLLIINIFSGVFYIIGASGYMTFMTRNMEIQWYRTSANANIVIGPVILGGVVAGFITSGWAISKFKPRPTYLLGWNVVVGIVFVLSEISFIFLACPDTDIVGFNTQTKSLNFINDCNMDCNCEKQKFYPVCLEESSLTFFSPCHAGCSVSTQEGKIRAYHNCSCVPARTTVTLPGIKEDEYNSYEYQTYGGTVKDGYCEQDCVRLEIIYFIISFVMQFLGSTGKIGNVLVNYRAVEPEEKSFASGVGLFLISLLAFIPGPVIYGYILDSTCLIWDTNCGREGNCSFYDRFTFRLYLNGTAACFTAVGALMDAWVCYLGRNIRMYDEEQEEEKPPFSDACLVIDSDKPDEYSSTKHNA